MIPPTRKKDLNFMHFYPWMVQTKEILLYNKLNNRLEQLQSNFL